jgi:hypothetical protein
MAIHVIRFRGVRIKENSWKHCSLAGDQRQPDGRGESFNRYDCLGWATCRGDGQGGGAVAWGRPRRGMGTLECKTNAPARWRERKRDYTRGLAESMRPVQCPLVQPVAPATQGMPRRVAFGETIPE